MKDVLLRHYPDLADTGLANIDNAFEPWDLGPLDPGAPPAALVGQEARRPLGGRRPASQLIGAAPAGYSRCGDHVRATRWASAASEPCGSSIARSTPTRSAAA